MNKDIYFTLNQFDANWLMTTLTKRQGVYYGEPTNKHYRVSQTVRTFNNTDRCLVFIF